MSTKQTPKSNLRKKKIKRNIPEGIFHINSSYNNVIITVTDMDGKTVCWSSAGKAKFKGTKKSTPYAAQLACKIALNEAILHGMKRVHVYLRGFGVSKEAANRTIRTFENIEIVESKDVTAFPFNNLNKKRLLRKKT